MSKKMFLPLRRYHGKIDDCFKFWKMIKRGKAQSKKLSAGCNMTNEDYPVDFVVLWVDGNDQNWLAEREKHLNHSEQKNRDNTIARYRDWDFFHYWFRSVEKYAPWVRYVYLVTCGHIPKWLNENHPKLKIINHKDFIPKEYLPTFSTIPIELNIWRINGISEHIVYFNDDMFLTKPVYKNDFFCNGYPKYCAIAKPEFPHANMDTWEHQLFNVAGIINSSFNIRQSIAKNPEKWFSYKYGDEIKYNIRVYEDNKIIGMFFSHLGAPCRVSTMKDVWNDNLIKMDKTCRNKFRTMGDLIFQIYELWEIVHGSFEPVDRYHYGIAANITPANFEKFKNIIMSENYKMVCPNDSDQLKVEDFEGVKNKLIEVFSLKFPEKSSFEL